MKILIDTNVLLDYMTKREGYFADAESIMELCSEGSVSGCMAVHSVINAFYIMRKLYSSDERRTMLLHLCDLLTVIGIGRDTLVDALNQNQFPDFEDCLKAAPQNPGLQCRRRKRRSRR